MAKLKLPEQLMAWRVVSTASETAGYPTFNVTKTEFNGYKTNAKLIFVTYEGENYNSENVDLINEEAAFVKSVMKLRGVSNYVDAVVDNVPSKSKISLYLLTTEAKSFKSTLDGRQLSEAEIVDLGLQLSEILDKLEQNNILHGNINPENVYINSDGRYILGGFTAFESVSDDPAYLAPEMQDGRQPDYTTDIYSIGLMMYALYNNGRLPFEDETTDRAAAIQKRRRAAVVPAPAGSNEKLKSIIVIACQPGSKNRWKNASNFKNALAAIKAELPAPAEQAPPTVIPPESTEFESNVFEEFAFEGEKPAPPAPVQEPAPPALSMAKGAAKAASAAQLLKPEVTVPADGENMLDVEVEAPGAKPEIDNKVFDDYELHTKVFTLRNPTDADNKNYGDFFEDEPVKQTPPLPVTPAKPQSNTGTQRVPQQQPPAYRDEAGDDGSEPAGHNKSFIIGVIVIIAAALVALAALGVFAAQKGLLPFFNNESSEPATIASPSSQPATLPPATTAPATVPSTTSGDEQETTVEPTTEAETTPVDVYPEDVVGLFYDYAEELLKDQGLNVEIEWKTSPDYDYGFVISMSPDSSTVVKTGSTIKLVVCSDREGGSSSSDAESSGSESSQSDEETED